MLPYYLASSEKLNDMLAELRESLPDPTALFRCLFLIDDFCGSGKTLLRELVVSKLDEACGAPIIPPTWHSRLRFHRENNELQLAYEGKLSATDREQLLQMGEGEAYVKAVDALCSKSENRDTSLKGSLTKVKASDLAKLLDPDAAIFFCPLLITEHALDRLEALIERLEGPFARTRILPGAILNSKERIISGETPIGTFCEKYYADDLEDEHTGCVKFGYDGCGLPLVLHHNTPNNSIYLLWARRKEGFNPLFVRYERHGREGA